MRQTFDVRGLICVAIRKIRSFVVIGKLFADLKKHAQ